MKTTIVLVHGAFAESASWDGVIDPLLEADLPVIAAANPLRGLAADAAAVSDLVRSIDGPVVLVGHSYGGAVITNVDADAGEIVGLVYVAGFAPERGESCSPWRASSRAARSATRWRPSRVPMAPPTCRSQGIASTNSSPQTCRPPRRRGWARRNGQSRGRRCSRPRVSGRSGRSCRRGLCSATTTRNIPAAVQRYMAERADAQRVIEIPGASHAVSVSHPRVTADLILEVASLRAAA